jgi:hypothetical protein
MLRDGSSFSLYRNLFRRRSYQLFVGKQVTTIVMGDAGGGNKTEQTGDLIEGKNRVR